MKFLIRIVVVILAATLQSPAQSLRVVTTQPDLASFVRLIGGDDVQVSSLTVGSEDMHLLRPRPSMLARLSRADLLIEMGLSLEHAWLPAIVRAVRNRKIRPGTLGLLNCSVLVHVLRKPKTKTRAEGPDLHPMGNPHYNLDPENMRVVAGLIRDRLSKLNPDGAERYKSACAKLQQDIDAHMKTWKAKLAPFRGAAFIEYHDSWIYFAKRFGLRIVERLEPAPGLAPTPSHLGHVISVGKSEHVKLIVSRPATADVAEKVARAIGGQAVTLPLSSTRKGRYKGYFHFMDQVVDAFAAGLNRPAK